MVVLGFYKEPPQREDNTMNDSIDFTEPNKIFSDRSSLKEQGTDPHAFVGQRTIRVALDSLFETLQRGRTPPSYILTGGKGTGETHVVEAVLADLAPTPDAVDVVPILFDATRLTSSRKTFTHIRDNVIETLPDSVYPELELDATNSERNLRSRLMSWLATLDCAIVLIFENISDSPHCDDLPLGLIEELRATSKIAASCLYLTREQDCTLTSALPAKDPVGHLQMDTYSREELVEILSDRAEQAFQDGSLTPRIISLCVDVLIEGQASPQTGLELLRRAGDEARTNGEAKVTVDHFLSAAQTVLS